MEKKAFDFVEPKYAPRPKNDIDREADRYLKEVGNPPGDALAKGVDRAADEILRESVRKR
jgi:hypothetical protein